MSGAMPRRWLKFAGAAALLAVAAVGGKAWFDTMREPDVQRLTLQTASLPAGARPFRIAFISDIHVAGPDMPPERLERIVAQINALKPDIVAIAGDLVSDKRTATHIYSPEEIVAPLGKLTPRLGVVVVPGNHDHWFDWPGLAAQLARYPRITVLRNEAAQIGPVAVAGVDDAYTGRDDLEASLDAMKPLTGIRVALSHSPDIFPQIPTDFDLVLAGHTHCGQIAYPWGGAPATMSEYGDLYACDVVRESGKTLVTSAGLGTSLIPVRLFTHPTIWLITVSPPPGEA